MNTVTAANRRQKEKTTAQIIAALPAGVERANLSRMEYCLSLLASCLEQGNLDAAAETADDLANFAQAFASNLRKG